MTFHEEAPPLNPWPFLVGDAALLATAYFIGNQAAAPLTGLPLIAIVACIALGAILAVIPFLVNHTRRQELALADRQREIAALAQTTATSAEQLSIAAASLHSIADNAARAAKLAEQLPHKVQERINDFKAQLNEVAVTENESLSQEINTLRTSETERLETALAGVRKTAADLAMIEAVSRKHIAELNESLARFASTAEKAATDAVRTIDAARTTAEKTLAQAQSLATDALKNAVADAVAQLGRHSAAAPREDNLATPPKENVPTRHFSTATSASSQPFSAPAHKEAPATPAVLEAPAPTGAADAHHAVSSAVAIEEKPARKRPPKKSAASEEELTLGIEMPASDFAQTSPDDSTPAVSADGFTRLLVTAYIGIGNKLFVRGEGPGLSWDRGVPLQFVSIGKWRWDTADATAPVTLKLYRNDELECTALGTVELEPGHQHEVTASFN